MDDVNKFVSVCADALHEWLWSLASVSAAAALRHGNRNPESGNGNGLRNQISMIENKRISHCII